MYGGIYYVKDIISPIYDYDYRRIMVNWFDNSFLIKGAGYVII